MRINEGEHHHQDSVYMHKKCAQECPRHSANIGNLSHKSEAEWQMKKSSRNTCQPSKIRDCAFQCERVCTQSHVETATITHTRFHTIDGILEHGLRNTLCSSFFRRGPMCNTVVALAVICSVLQRGTDIREFDVRHTRLFTTTSTILLDTLKHRQLVGKDLCRQTQKPFFVTVRRVPT